MELGWLLAMLVLFLLCVVWFSWRYILEHSLEDSNSASRTVSSRVSSMEPSLAGVARLRTALSRWLPDEDPLMRDLTASYGRLALEVQDVVARWKSLRRRLAFSFTTPENLRAFYDQLRELSIKISSVYNGNVHRYHDLVAVERYVGNTLDRLDYMACSTDLIEEANALLEGAFVLASQMSSAYDNRQWEEANNFAIGVGALLEEITRISHQVSTSGARE